MTYTYYSIISKFYYHTYVTTLREYKEVIKW